MRAATFFLWASYCMSYSPGAVRSMAPPTSKRCRRSSIVRRKVLSEEDALVAAQSKAINAEIWSFDRAFRNNPGAVRNLGVKVAPECTQVPLVSTQTPADYRVGRRLMSMAPIEVGLNGQVTSPGPRGGTAGAYTASVGVPEEVPKAGGPSPKGQALVVGVVLALEGINFVLNIINDNIQRKKANESLDTVRLAIGQARTANPTHGILLLFFYTQVDAGDSIIRPGAVFHYLMWGHGATHDEARVAGRVQVPHSLTRDFTIGAKIRPGSLDSLPRSL
jgi:hypothetical protein